MRAPAPPPPSEPPPPPPDPRLSDGVLALSLGGFLLLLPPVIGIADQPVTLWGLPILYLYILVVWTGAVALAALLAHRLCRHMGDEGRRSPGGPGRRQPALPPPPAARREPGDG